MPETISPRGWLGGLRTRTVELTPDQITAVQDSIIHGIEAMQADYDPSYEAIIDTLDSVLDQLADTEGT
jgi:hypothetical protein